MNTTTPDSDTTTWPDVKDNLLAPNSSSIQTYTATSSSPAQPRWPNPQESIGFPCSVLGFLGARTCWEVVGPALDISRPLLRSIKELLDQHADYLHNVSIMFPISFGLFMIGKSEEDADPTLVISSERELTRIRCINIVRRSCILKRYPGVLLGSSYYSPTSLKRIRSRDTLSAADKDFVFFTPPSTNDVCGRPIHVIERSVSANYHTTSIQQKATMGGFVRLRTADGDDLYCGLTVAHAFKDGFQIPITNSLMDFAFDGERGSPDSVEDTTMSDGPDSHLSAHFSMISNMVNISLDNKTYLNSVKDMSVAGIGTQLASSFNGQHPDLNWALIEIQRPHHEPANVTSINWVTGEGQIYIEHTAPAITDTIDVLVITSVGCQTAILSGSPIFYKSPRGVSSEEVYVVRLDGKLGSGDGGCWVINPESGDLYGHIIGTCPEARTAYLTPAHRIFNDIKEHLGGTVELAGRTRFDSYGSQTSLLLGMNQSDESVIRQLRMSKAAFAEIAVETELIHQALIVNPSNLKPYLKKRSPYAWHDITDKAKYESIIRLSCSTNPRTQPYWETGRAGPSGNNLLAKWFLFRKFRLTGTSHQRSFGEAHPQDLDLMFMARPASRMRNRSGRSTLEQN